MSFERFVQPKVFWLGYQEIRESELIRYLEHTKQTDFLQSYEKAREQGLSSAEILCSFYAKLCYKALILGKNKNVTRVRDIWDNICATFDSAHGSVFEHVNFNFVVTDCSRVYTHEQVRHRIGVAYSQTSGRYCRLDQIPIVLDPILDDCRDILTYTLEKIEDAVHLMECRKGLRVPPPSEPALTVDDSLRRLQTLRASGYDAQQIEEMCKTKGIWIPNDKMPFDQKKKITSAIRRIAPNGIANEMGFSTNLRSLRHQIMMRTAPGAEWEIRLIFSQLYELLKPHYKLIFHGAKTKIIEGLPHIYGMKQQPYEATREEVLAEMSSDEISTYLQGRLTQAV